MELRRALLLFAIVLGLAAVVASVSRTERPQQRTSSVPATPPPTSTPEAQAVKEPEDEARVGFSQATPTIRRTVTVGRPTVVDVRVEEAGQVAIEGLGLVDSADGLDPARFEVLAEKPGRYRVLFGVRGDVPSQRIGLVQAKARKP